MIIIQSIRVRNFRSIREATFKPLQKGITGIFGANGAGKTTFLSATMWCLFGTRPPGGSVASLRRENANPTRDECSVSVLFVHLKQQIEVIRELKGKANNSVVTIYVDGVKQSVASVGAAEAWVINRLGIDATGFETAFVVKQKELDRLITAKPTERKAIIEKLAGIDTINMALKEAREAENATKKSLAHFPGSQEAAEQAEAIMNNLADRAEQLGVDREAMVDRQNKLMERANALQGELDELRETELALGQYQADLRALDTERGQLRERQESLAYIAEFTGDADELETLRVRHQDLSSALREKSEASNALRVQQQGLLVEQGNSERLIIQLTERQGNLMAVDESEEVLALRKEHAEQQIAQARNNIAIAQNHIADLESSIALLGHTDECPTCHTVLDDKHALVRSFETKIAEYRTLLAENQQRGSEMSAEVQRLDAALDAVRERVYITTELAQAQGALEAAHTALAPLTGQLADLEVEIAQLNSEREQVTELGVKARNLANDRATLQRLLERLTAIDGEEAALRQRVAIANQTVGKVDIETKRRELGELRQQIQKNAPQLEQTSGERSTINARLATARKDFELAMDQWRRRRDMLKDAERRGLVTQKLDKFRTDTIASLAPELSEHASDLISDMTNNEFTEVRLDDDFNPFVTTAAGQERPAEWLSGGELSAVALALRIAIGYLITGGNPDLLWLDEVMTAQDADRRSAMLALIRSLPIDQIIMINHTADAQDIVDKSINLQIDRVNGSYIADAE
jgi:exonuclease SbcC